MKTFFIVAGVLFLLLLGYAGFTYIKQDPPDVLVQTVTNLEEPPPLPQGDRAPLEVPEGFVATIFSREVTGARDMIRDPKGVLLVSLMSEGKVVALPDLDSSGVADRAVTVLENLRQPHGLAVRCASTGFESADQDDCTLYVAETNAVVAYAYDADTYTTRDGRVLAELPYGDGHYTRSLLLHPDGQQLLVAVGSSCNVCVEDDERRAAILSLDLATNELAPYATGLRNSVFLATDPVTGEVWATDNGRDLLGDDIPPDEVNVIVQGSDYGWPYCYGQKVHDEDFDPQGERTCADTIAAQINLQAHSAGLGLAFIPEEGWPEEMRLDLLVAYHGSWNRSVPTGYKVVRFDLSPTGARSAQSGPQDFLTGFLETNDPDEAIGRPVAILAEPGGVAYISDDRAGAIYRISRTDME